MLLLQSIDFTSVHTVLLCVSHHIIVVVVNHVAIDAQQECRGHLLRPKASPVALAFLWSLLILSMAGSYW